MKQEIDISKVQEILSELEWRINNKVSKETLLENCVKQRLDSSLEYYVKDLDDIIDRVQGKENKEILKILKVLNRE